ncbi:WYL domain-containing protein [Rubrivivax gelatinosus]|uniref:WYL domain-containing protein n=1 Tax=Rubrivivax gelatinosus TaxID=28068 RepID=A0A4R2MFM0_RUBGE|nr:WYL domain-containing protein [Rubrivivax gelatinosus]TCP03314.1 WYL domain-containing protein [Rubrivivax gelatinosus]
MDFFGISVPQSSLDIAKYSELAPSNLAYDRSARVYVSTPEFAPLYPSSDPGRFLNELLAHAAGLNADQTSLLGWTPAVATVPSPGRTFQTEVLVALLRAIRDKCALRVLYQSMSRPQPVSRTMTPHALAHDGFRWHVRAYCHTRKQFLDFVIARMLEVDGFEEAGARPEQDLAWHRLVPLVLVPHPDLSASHRRAIELDYGMQNGYAVFECRQAFLFYALRHLRLDLTGATKPEEQQIALRNRAEVQALLAPAD